MHVFILNVCHFNSLFHVTLTDLKSRNIQTGAVYTSFHKQTAKTKNPEIGADFNMPVKNKITSLNIFSTDAAMLLHWKTLSHQINDRTQNKSWHLVWCAICILWFFLALSLSLSKLNRHTHTQQSTSATDCGPSACPCGRHLCRGSS